MSEKEIIERLILDIDCLLHNYYIDRNDDDLDFFNKLRCSGEYKIYPPYNEQSFEQKEKIKILINKTLNNE